MLPDEAKILPLTPDPSPRIRINVLADPLTGRGEVTLLPAE